MCNFVGLSRRTGRQCSSCFGISGYRSGCILMSPSPLSLWPVDGQDHHPGGRVLGHNRHGQVQNPGQGGHPPWPAAPYFCWCAIQTLYLHSWAALSRTHIRSHAPIFPLSPLSFSSTHTYILSHPLTPTLTHAHAHIQLCLIHAVGCVTCWMFVLCACFFSFSQASSLRTDAL